MAFSADRHIERGAAALGINIPRIARVAVTSGNASTVLPAGAAAVASAGSIGLRPSGRCRSN